MNGRFRDSQWDRHGVLEGIFSYVKIPPMALVAQQFDDNFIKDVPSSVAGEFAKPEINTAICPGQTVAVTAGSRGITDIAPILRETVKQLKKLQVKPFLFPAMGSHGGATVEGQLEIMKDYGITEENMGAPIRASMETVVIGHTPEGKEVHLDRHAHEADGILVVGRIKPHPAFRNKYESGFLKMLAIGMGKQKGAESCHNEGWGKMAENIETYADVIMAKKNILFGLAIVENAFDKTCHIEAVPKTRFKEREAALLEVARTLMPRIYIPKFDILIVDQVGKNFSGDGADPNISGRFGTPYASGGPTYQRLVFLDVSKESHGNAVGIGLADFSTKRLFDKIDFDAIYPNCITSLVPMVGNVPMILKNDRTAIQAAIHCCLDIDKSKPKIVRIKNTSHIDEILISEALVEEAKKHPKMKIIREPQEPVFDAEGNLILNF